MSYQYFRMDTSSMSVEHRKELLDSINKCIGIGWANWAGEPSIFRLTWNDEYDFAQFTVHSDECMLTPWESC